MSEQFKEFFVAPRYTGGKPRLVRLTIRQSTKNFCLLCKGWRGRDVEKCKEHGCALYNFRNGLMDKYHTLKDRKLAVAQYCLDCSGGVRLEECKVCYLQSWFRFVTEEEANAWIRNPSDSMAEENI